MQANAADVMAVVYDEGEAPLFPGVTGRAEAAAWVLSVASSETQGFQKDIEDGLKRGDGGYSWCNMQIHLPGSSRILLKDDGYYAYAYKRGVGWNGPDLVGAANRQNCYRAGLHVMRESLKVCRNLSVYTSGKCLRDEPSAKYRERRAKEWLRKVPPPVEDSFLLPSRLALQGGAR